MSEYQEYWRWYKARYVDDDPPVLPDKIEGQLLWSPESARVNSPGASLDLGRITLANAEKLAWIYGVKLVKVTERNKARAAGACANPSLPLPSPEKGNPLRTCKRQGGGS